MTGLALKKITWKCKKTVCGCDSRTLHATRDGVRITLGDNVVLVEKVGHDDTLIPLFDVDSMIPLEDLSPGDFGKPKSKLKDAQEETAAA